MCGSTTPSNATAATAASAAVPPALSTAIAASLASGWEVAAMPSQAKTGERPGLWKSRNIAGRGRWGGLAAGRGVFGLDGRRAAMSSADAHGESAGYIDKADEKQKEERGRGRFLNQQELRHHADEQQHREDMVYDTPPCPSGPHHFHREDQDRDGDHDIAGSKPPFAVRFHAKMRDLIRPDETGHQESQDVVDREGNNQQRNAHRSDLGR